MDCYMKLLKLQLSRFVFMILLHVAIYDIHIPRVKSWSVVRKAIIGTVFLHSPLRAMLLKQ